MNDYFFYKEKGISNYKLLKKKNTIYMCVENWKSACR